MKFNLAYVNDVTEHGSRYELMELTMELANSALAKCQFQFRSLDNF